MRAKIIAPARREFLKEVVYYNQQESGLGAAFAKEIEEATARALAFPESGSPATKNTKRVFAKRFPFSKDSRFLLFIARTGKALLFLPLPIIHATPIIGHRAYNSANRRLLYQALVSKHHKVRNTH